MEGAEVVGWKSGTGYGRHGQEGRASEGKSFTSSILGGWLKLKNQLARSLCCLSRHHLVSSILHLCFIFVCYFVQERSGNQCLRFCQTIYLPFLPRPSVVAVDLVIPLLFDRLTASVCMQYYSHLPAPDHNDAEQTGLYIRSSLLSAL
jgi:hypothetical protein